MITSGGNRNPAKLDRGAGAARRRGISPAFLSRPSVNATKPDNVLFEGGQGETLRRKLLAECDVHTLLRLPTGIFYAGVVKANVLFFDARRPRVGGSAWTSKLWVYDFRTGQHFTLRQRKLHAQHLADFVTAYHAPDRREVEDERFRCFTYDELLARDKVNLDISWLRDPDEEGDELQPPEVIAHVEDLQSALNEFAAVAEALALAAAELDARPSSGEDGRPIG
jgi:type I restriction enzyme M protein